jgi:hypothetical protein
MELFTSNNTNISCPLSIAWNQSGINRQQSALIVCLIAIIIYTGFWLQLVFYSSLRQKSMQWIYAYLITDILLLFRFFFTYIIHTTSTECAPNRIWALFICYFEATVDNYLNILEVYIILALNICRYIQIAYNRNVYTTDQRILIVAHFSLYLIPLLFFLIQFLIGWAQLEQFTNDLCDVIYTNDYIQIFNMIMGFVLPVVLNIFVIYASVRHVRLISNLRRARNHVSAREKYNRSLIIQFVVFYIIWILLWSPNVIVYQISANGKNLIMIVRLLNFIEIALDPIIIGALDVRFWRTWGKIWLQLKNKYLRHLQVPQRQIRPIVIDPNIREAEKPQETAL